MNLLKNYAFSFLSYCVIGIYFMSYWITIFTARIKKKQKDEKVLNVNKKKRSGLNVIENIMENGYNATKHIVQTQDGYILTLFRIQRREGEVKGPPLLLMHGLLQSASMWIDAGPGVALAYLLADAGYDVWLGNNRGTRYSRQHAWLNPDTDLKYWQFCVTEIGSYDLPAFIDYILPETRALKLNYIGFSQGGGSFFVMCSERPEYRSKINIMIGLAPAARVLNTKSLVFNTLFEFYEKTEQRLNSYGVCEVLPHGGYIQSFLQNFCTLSDLTTKLCESGVSLLDASNPGSVTKSCFQTTLKGTPAGTSVHNMARYGQAIKSPNFQKFDYGPKENLVHYGSETPPIFNLSSVNVPTVIMYGGNDAMVNYKDIDWLVDRLPNVVEAYKMNDPKWTHLDFFMSRHIPKRLYPKIEEYLKRFS